MKSAHHLFELIQSLSSTEKSYIKKSSSADGNKEKSYIKLFDILNDMKTYDENLLNSKLKKAGIEKSISNLKDYLYELILENLVSYHKSSEDEFMLLQKYQNNKILVKKGLFQQANIYSKELYREADEKHNHWMRLMALDPRIISICLQGSNEELEELIAQFETEFTFELGQVKNEYYQHLLFMKNALNLRKINYSQNLQEVVEIREDYKDLLSKFKPIHYEKNLSGYYNELGVYYYLTKESISEYVYKKKAFDIFLNNEQLLKSNLDNFSVLCYNMGWRNMMNRLFDQYEYIMAQSRRIKLMFEKKLTPLARYQFEITYYGIVLIYYKQSGQIMDQVHLIDETKDWLAKTDHQIYYLKNRITEDIIECYYYTKQYKKAVDCIMSWLNDGDKNIIRNKVNAWMYLLIIHFEEANYDLVASLFVPAVKYLRKCHLSNEYIIYFIKLFKNIYKDISLLDDKIYLRKVIDEFPNEESLMRKIGSFRFHTWIESRLNKASYYEQYCKTIEGYNYEMLDKLIDLNVPLYETDFLKAYKKTGIKI